MWFDAKLRVPSSSGFIDTENSVLVACKRQITEVDSSDLL